MNAGEARILVSETEALITESRRVLDEFYAGRRGEPIHRPDPMICVLCDCEARVMTRLAFRFQEANGLSDGTTRSLTFRLQKRFGVCDSCLRLYKFQYRRIVLAVNRRLREAPAA